MNSSEQHQKQKGQQQTAVAKPSSSTAPPGGGGDGCWLCGHPGHLARNCTSKQTKQPNKQDVKCYFCGELGHFEKNCPRLKPRETSKHQQPTSQVQKGKERESSSHKKEASSDLKPVTDSAGPDRLQQTIHQTGDVPTSSRGRRPGHGRGRGRGGGQGQGRGGFYNEGRYKDHFNQPVSHYDEFSRLPHFLDTHCHLEYLLERLRIRKYKELARRYGYPDNYDGCITSFCDPAGLSSLSSCDQILAEPKVWGSFGFHPHHAGYLTDSLEDKMISRLKEPKCLAFGELGLDYSEHSLQQSDKESQKMTVRRLMQMCPIFEKPLVLHCRDAEDDLFHIMKDVLPPDWKIHLHCYTGALETATKLITHFPNLYLGITGHVTYHKYRQTRDILRSSFPLDRFLLETDAPYMPPAGVEERWSHPPMVVHVAQEVARIRGMSVEEVLEVTRENARKIYGI